MWSRGMLAASPNFNLQRMNVPVGDFFGTAIVHRGRSQGSGRVVRRGCSSPQMAILWLFRQSDRIREGFHPRCGTPWLQLSCASQVC